MHSTTKQFDPSNSTAVGFHKTRSIAAFASNSGELDEDLNKVSILSVWNYEHNISCEIKILKSISKIFWFEDFIICLTTDGYRASFYYKEVISKTPTVNTQTEKKPQIKSVDIDEDFASSKSDDESFSDDEEEIETPVNKEERSEIIFIEQQESSGVEKQVFDFSESKKIIVGASHCLNIYIINPDFNLNTFLQTKTENNPENLFFKKSTKSKIFLPGSSKTVAINKFASHIVAIASENVVSIHSIKKKAEIHRIDNSQVFDIQNVCWDLEKRAKLYIQTTESTFMYDISSGVLNKICTGGNSLFLENDNLYITADDSLKCFKVNKEETPTNYDESLGYDVNTCELINSAKLNRIGEALFKLPLVYLRTSVDTGKLTNINSLFSTETTGRKASWGKFITTGTESYKFKESPFLTENSSIVNILKENILKQNIVYKNFNLEDNFIRKLIFNEEVKINGDELKITEENLLHLISNNKESINLSNIKDFKTLLALSIYTENYEPLKSFISKEEYEILALILIEKGGEKLLNEISEHVDYPFSAYIHLTLGNTEKFLQMMKGNVSVFEYNNIMNLSCSNNLLNTEESKIYSNIFINTNLDTQSFVEPQRGLRSPTYSSNSKSLSNSINFPVSKPSKFGIPPKSQPINSTVKPTVNSNIQPINSTVKSNIQSNIQPIKRNEIVKPAPPKINREELTRKISGVKEPIKPSAYKPAQNTQSQNTQTIQPQNIQTVRTPTINNTNNNINNIAKFTKPEIKKPMPPSIEQLKERSKLASTPRMTPQANLSRPPVVQNLNNIVPTQQSTTPLGFDGFISIYDTLLEVNAKKPGVIYRSRVRNAEAAKKSFVSGRESMTSDMINDLEPLFVNIDIERLISINSNPEDKQAKEEYKSSNYNIIKNYAASVGTKYSGYSALKPWLEHVLTLVKCVIY